MVLIYIIGTNIGTYIHYLFKYWYILVLKSNIGQEVGTYWYIKCLQNGIFYKTYRVSFDAKYLNNKLNNNIGLVPNSFEFLYLSNSFSNIH